MNNPLLYILGSIVIGLVTSYFTVWLSLRRFRSEKLWERKIESYTRIIEALYGLKKEFSERMEAYFEEIHEAYVGNGVMPVKSDSASFHLYEEELKKYRDIGALIISIQAVKLINQYHENLSTDEYDEASRFSIDIKAAEECLEAIILEAKKDLAR